MDYADDTTEHIKNKHLSYDERVKIELRLKDGWSAYRIAKYELQCAANTVRNEIGRGTVLFYRGKVARYKARAGQEAYEARRQNSRKPYHVLEKIKFLTYVTQHFQKDKLKRKPSKKRSHEHKKTLGRSIEERHADVEKREVFGHWEADLVIGSKSGEDAVLLVMVERKSRNYLVMRVKDKTAASVMQGFAHLRSHYGAAFGLVFNVY